MMKQEDGWVVCRVFKKKSCNTNRGFQPDHEVDHRDHEEHDHMSRMELAGVSRSMMMLPIEHNSQALSLCDTDYSLLDGSMHLPQLLSPDVVADSISAVVHNNHPHAHPHPPSFLPGPSLNGAVGDVECCNSQNLRRLTSGSGGCSGGGFVQHNEEKFSSDWTFLDKLLSSHQSFDQQSRCYSFMPQPAIAHHHHAVPSSAQKFPLPVQPFHYVGSEPEFLKFFHK